jgi:hypothetical protein
MASVTILHRGPRYCVRFLRCNDLAAAVLCFEYWMPEPTLDGPFAAEAFFAHRGTNAIGILAARNDWFQHAEITEALAAIRAVTPGWDLVGYGGSMGGFAAINFAAALGLRAVVAVCPQYSIQAARAPYEARWRAEEAAITADGGFGHDAIDAVPRLTRGWLVYDPLCVDGRHAADIREHHGLGELRVRFGGHDQMRMLQQAEVFTSMLVDMIEDRFDPMAFRRAWRAARRRSATFWLGLSDALWRRGVPAGAARAAQAARALPHPEPAAADLAEAKARLGLGDAAAVHRLAAPWADHPAWGADARWCLAQMPAQPPAPPRRWWNRLVGRR